MVVTHIRALLIVSLGCVVFGAPALSPYAQGRSKPSDIHQKRAVCHPKGRSRTSAHLASLFSGDQVVLIDPPRRTKVETHRRWSLEPTPSSARAWHSLTCISGHSRLPLHC